MLPKQRMRAALALMLATLWAAPALAGPYPTVAPAARKAAALQTAMSAGMPAERPDHSDPEYGEAEGEFDEQPDSADGTGETADGAAADGGDGGDSFGGIEQSQTVKSRTASEQSLIGEIEQRYRAAMHTPVVSAQLSIDAAIGYGGVAAYARPIPVEVTLKNVGGDLDGAVAINLYRTNTYYDRVKYPVFLAAGAEQRLRFFITLTAKQDLFTVEYEVGGQTVASVNVTPDRVAAPGSCLVGALSDDPDSLSFLTITDKNDALLRGEYFQAAPVAVAELPDAADAMAAFGMLAVDGADLTALTAAQQAALDLWLRGGGVILVGGGAKAATDYPFFERYTSVAAGTLYQSADITPALLAALGETGAALGQGSLLNRIAPGERTVARLDDDSLIEYIPVGRGAVLLAAFELGGRPLTDWAGVETLWQRVLLKAAPNAYTGLFLGEDYYHYRGYYRGVLSQMPVKTAPSARSTAMGLLIGFVAVSGAGMYLLLKKLDRRELLWLTMPALALAVSLLMLRIGATGDAGQPIAVSYTLASLAADGGAQLDTEVGAATSSRDAITLSAGPDVTLALSEDSRFEDNYFDGGTFLKTPSKLRYVRTLGAENSVTLPAAAAWTLNEMTTTDNRGFEGAVPGSVWLEDDGLHGRVKNGTAYPLTNCLFVCAAGFADLGDLAPGEEAEFALSYLSDEEAELLKQSQTADNYRGYAPEGRIVGPEPDGTGGYVSPDTILLAAMREEYRLATEAQREAAVRAMDAESRQWRDVRDSMVRTYGDWVYGGEAGRFYRFYGFSEQLGAVDLTLDGERVSRAAHLGLIDAEVAYQPVGPTGLAYYPIGLLPAHIANADGGAPRMLAEAGAGSYYRLTTQPAFGFEIPDAAALGDLAVELRSTYYGQSPSMALYNWQTGAWDVAAGATLTLSGDDLARYLGEGGQLYLRYGPGARSDSYDDVMLPAISVTGRYLK
ncbi:MAG: hypothetical protein GX558_02960 [Clostridiales bacterium]|nr:hypothetical protein [Clostridiales bacterium]